MFGKLCGFHRFYGTFGRFGCVLNANEPSVLCDCLGEFQHNRVKGEMAKKVSLANWSDSLVFFAWNQNLESHQMSTSVSDPASRLREDNLKADDQSNQKKLHQNCLRAINADDSKI